MSNLTISIQSNIFNLVNKSYSWYDVKDSSLGIDATAHIKEDNKITVTGQGSKKFNAIIKGYVEEYEEQNKSFEVYKEKIESLLNNIITLSKNKVSFEKISLYKDNGIYRCYAVVFRTEEPQLEGSYREKVGSIDIDCCTLEILEYRGNRKSSDLIDKFVNAYNNFINANDKEETISNTIEQPETTPETKSYYIAYNRAFNTYEDAYSYCITSDFDTEAIEEIKTSSIDAIQSNIIDNLFNGSKLETKKEDIKNYIINEEIKEDKKGRYLYELDNNYKIAESFINALSYNYFNKPEYDGQYQGERLTCGKCKYFNNGLCSKIKAKYSHLNIDIKLHHSNDICKYFENKITITYDESKYKSIEDYLNNNNYLLCNKTIEDWKKQKFEYIKSFNDYLQFLHEDYYINYKGNSIVNDKWNYLYINNYTIELYLNNNWFNLDFINDNNINCRTLKVKTNRRNKSYDILVTNNNFDLKLLA